MVNDGSDIAELMSCFTKKKVQDPKFPVLSEEVSNLKDTEGGASAVCEVMRHYEDIARKEGMRQGMRQGMQQGMQKGMQQEKMNNARSLLRAGMSADLICQCLGLTREQMEELQSADDPS